MTTCTPCQLKLLLFLVVFRTVQLLWHQLRVSVLVLKERLLQGLQDSNGNYTRQTDILQAFSQDQHQVITRTMLLFTSSLSSEVPTILLHFQCCCRCCQKPPVVFPWKWSDHKLRLFIALISGMKVHDVKKTKATKIR